MAPAQATSRTYPKATVATGPHRLPLAPPRTADTVSRSVASSSSVPEENALTAAKTVAILMADPTTTAARTHAPTSSRSRLRSPLSALTRPGYAAPAGSARLMALASTSAAAARGCTARELVRRSAAARAAVSASSGRKSPPWRAGRRAPCLRKEKKHGGGGRAAMAGSGIELG
uniref:Uncharacterized protein n=1 Tax=Triticum urartu TaxID=4572 RepID=A0A8R7USC7_TRIUA